LIKNYVNRISFDFEDVYFEVIIIGIVKFLFSILLYWM